MNKRIRKKRYKAALRAAGYWTCDTKGPKVYHYRSERFHDGRYYSLCTLRPKSHFKPCAYGWKSIWNPWSIKFGVWTGLPRDKDDREQYLIEHDLKENDYELYTED